jgi:hypothetical protein
MIEIELPFPFNDLAEPKRPNPADLSSYITTILEYIEGLATTLHVLARQEDCDQDTLRSVTLLLKELSRSSLTLWRYSQRAGRA